MKTLQQTLMDRDGLTADEARVLILQAEGRVLGGDDPEEVLQEEFGLEPDYVMELICGATVYAKHGTENINDKLPHLKSVF